MHHSTNYHKYNPTIRLECGRSGFEPQSGQVKDTHDYKSVVIFYTTGSKCSVVMISYRGLYLVMTSILDEGFELWSGQVKDWTIGTCCFPG